MLTNAGCALSALAVCLGLAGSVIAQQPALNRASCNPWKFQHDVVADFSFKERACSQAARLVKPSMALHGALVAGYGQWRNNPEVFHESSAEFAHRFAVFYARRTAQNAGELIAGYLNHENPLPPVSQQHGFWNRTRSALLSVVQTKDANGNVRPALAPIAGAFGSGMVGVACYEKNNNAAYGFRRTGIVYSGYFGNALFREFKPDLSTFAYHLLRQKRPY
jgi:hypothetical protein